MTQQERLDALNGAEIRMSGIDFSDVPVFNLNVEEVTTESELTTSLNAGYRFVYYNKDMGVETNSNYDTGKFYAHDSSGNVQTVMLTDMLLDSAIASATGADLDKLPDTQEVIDYVDSRFNSFGAPFELLTPITATTAGHPENSLPAAGSVKTGVVYFGRIASGVSVNGEVYERGGLAFFTPTDDQRNGSWEYVEMNDDLNIIQTVTNGDTASVASSDAVYDFVTGIQTTLQNAINLKANDNAVVHLTGAETVAGDKTFTGTTVLASTTVGGTLTANGSIVFDSQSITGITADLSSSATINQLARADAIKSYVDNVNTTLQNDINSRALDNAVVHLAGNETITGLKTFNGGASFLTSSGVTDVTINGDGDFLVDVDTQIGGVLTANGNLVFDNHTFTGVTSDLSTSAANGQIATADSIKTYADGLDAQNVKLTGAQSIAGVKTFSDDTNLGGDVTVTGLATFNGGVSLGGNTFNGSTTDLTVSAAADEVASALAIKSYVDSQVSSVDLTPYGIMADAESVTGIWNFVNGIGIGGNTIDTVVQTVRALGSTSNTAIVTETGIRTELAILQADINTRALDNAVVKLTGAQTVAGSKAFSDVVVLDGGATLNNGEVLTFANGTVSFNEARNSTTGLRGSSTASDTAVMTEKAISTYVETIQTALQNAINTLDNSVVKLTGAQSIGGVKTFSDDVIVSGQLSTSDLSLNEHQFTGVSTDLASSAAANEIATAQAIKNYIDDVADNTVIKQDFNITGASVSNLYTLTTALLNGAGIGTVMNAQVFRVSDNKELKGDFVKGGEVLVQFAGKFKAPADNAYKVTVFGLPL